MGLLINHYVPEKLPAMGEKFKLLVYRVERKQVKMKIKKEVEEMKGNGKKNR